MKGKLKVSAKNSEILLFTLKGIVPLVRSECSHLSKTIGQMCLQSLKMCLKMWQCLCRLHRRRVDIYQLTFVTPPCIWWNKHVLFFSVQRRMTVKATLELLLCKRFKRSGLKNHLVFVFRREKASDFWMLHHSIVVYVFYFLKLIAVMCDVSCIQRVYCLNKMCSAFSWSPLGTA